MKTSVEKTKSGSKYPLLMEAPLGAIVMYTSKDEGVIVHTTAASGWVVGEAVTESYADDMKLFNGELILEN